MVDSPSQAASSTLARHSLTGRKTLQAGASQLATNLLLHVTDGDLAWRVVSHLTVWFGSPDLLGELQQTFINTLLSAEADAGVAPSTGPLVRSGSIAATATGTVTSIPAPGR